MSCVWEEESEKERAVGGMSFCFMLFLISVKHVVGCCLSHSCVNLCVLRVQVENAAEVSPRAP